MITSSLYAISVLVICLGLKISNVCSKSFPGIIKCYSTSGSCFS